MMHRQVQKQATSESVSNAPSETTEARSDRDKEIAEFLQRDTTRRSSLRHAAVDLLTVAGVPPSRTGQRRYYVCMYLVTEQSTT